MSKTVLSLIAAGVLSVATLPLSAQAMVPDATTGAGTSQSTLAQDRARLNRDRQMLRRDIRLGRTTDAARLRRQINADERAISRAKRTAQPMPSAHSMLPQPPTSPQSQTNTNTTTPQPPTKNQ